MGSKHVHCDGGRVFMVSRVNSTTVTCGLHTCTVLTGDVVIVVVVDVVGLFGGFLGGWWSEVSMLEAFLQ